MLYTLVPKFGSDLIPDISDSYYHYFKYYHIRVMVMEIIICEKTIISCDIISACKYFLYPDKTALLILYLKSHYQRKHKMTLVRCVVDVQKSASPEKAWLCTEKAPTLSILHLEFEFWFSPSNKSLQLISTFSM